MGFKIKNITYLLDKTNINYNKPIVFKLEKNLINTIYKLLPYQEMIFDSPLLPKEIKKMEMLGMVFCVSVNDNIIDSINNPKNNKIIEDVIEIKKTKSTKKV